MLVKPLIHKALIIKNYFVFILPEEPEELEDELVEEPRESVSDSLVKLASDSLDTLCWSFELPRNDLFCFGDL
ncbi:uncharacterized protein OCT59_000792 [Rhizophagus irregularis]|uniref:uncharacterized protein n=1 Tax=Rhizophagus irregularis TaxID=588596 RepID=UPI00332FF87D|nr:hypothetical protein OCT59_000792 [Rhizophagus irregularis]